ncbi:hypothetical protein CYR40_06095 [Chimaeribacter arupi]|uniref:cell envelope integrity TolA C-terminal domain-containing protein n=1 Tax=Chimaeribacter arupi TaxID=2060066 RepID=UPI000C7BE91F|nr:cell envelope integrity TolA C-terminal domain-containing protein [Chimaeribacter arupi]PLR36542.1 hypothetical protein CYR23_06285 [Chimaeribacter arupi]PLR48733.1 hypothetical protein CYR40_06095 [Chimaeribacter arupi]
MKKAYRVIAALTALTLLGCQNHTKRAFPLPSEFPTASEIKSDCESQNSTASEQREVMVWYCQVHNAIQYRFFDAKTYHGKVCDLAITQPQGKPPVSIKAQGGDPELCAVAIETIKQAIKSDTFPMRPAGLKDVILVHFAP